MKIIVFLTIGKAPHRKPAAGALNESSRSLIWSFWEQKVFLEICEKSAKSIKIGSILDTSQIILKSSIFSKNLENVGSEPCARPLGYGRLRDSFKPLVLALRRSLRFFLFFSSAKNTFPNKNNACLLRKYNFLVRFLLFWPMLT